MAYDFFKMRDGLHKRAAETREKLELLQHILSLARAAMYIGDQNPKEANELFQSCIGYHNLEAAQKILKKYEIREVREDV